MAQAACWRSACPALSAERKKIVHLQRGNRPETQGLQLRSNWEKDYGFGSLLTRVWNSATKVKAFFRFRTNMHFITGKAKHIGTMVSWNWDTARSTPCNSQLPGPGAARETPGAQGVSTAGACVTPGELPAPSRHTSPQPTVWARGGPLPSSLHRIYTATGKINEFS